MPPAGHWEGAFIEVSFPGSNGTLLTLTTETLILPTTYPIEPCFGQDCFGTMV